MFGTSFEGGRDWQQNSHCSRLISASFGSPAPTMSSTRLQYLRELESVPDLRSRCAQVSGVRCPGWLPSGVRGIPAV